MGKLSYMMFASNVHMDESKFQGFRRIIDDYNADHGTNFSMVASGDRRLIGHLLYVGETLKYFPMDVSEEEEQEMNDLVRFLKNKGQLRIDPDFYSGNLNHISYMEA